MLTSNPSAELGTRAQTAGANQPRLKPETGRKAKNLNRAPWQNRRILAQSVIPSCTILIDNFRQSTTWPN